VKLITAHKILIASATVFFVFFALWELNRYSNSNDAWTMARGILYFLVALGFGIYLKNFKRWYK
jgi:cell division protein FtsW (lipid II flippase)